MSTVAHQAELGRAPTRTAARTARVAGLLSRPHVVSLGCIAVLSVAAWAYIGVMLAPALGDGEAVSPGSGASISVWLPGLSGERTGIVAVLCGGAGPVASEMASWSGAGAILAMWAAMTAAMMLPTATPMVMTYADLADTAARQREPVASPLWLIAGYGSVWLMFAVAATALQFGLSGVVQAAGLERNGAVVGGVLFLVAGAYQFSALKHACLRVCQRPFPFFFANWTSHRVGVLRLGLRQGLACLGCCWAAMLLMEAVGAMNVVWMAGLGIVLAIEKVQRTGRLSRIVGAAFLLLGAVMIGAALHN